MGGADAKAVLARGRVKTLPSGGWDWDANTSARLAVISCNHLWYTNLHVPPSVR
jgi:hypothetical protein